MLAEASERALARDLRNTWAARDGVEVDLGFADTGDLAVLDAAARRAKYVQWDEVLPAVPELIDDAARLDAAADELGAGPRAFDVEWSDRAGAALLQLATKEGAVILDVPRLCASREGCAALRRAFRARRCWASAARRTSRGSARRRRRRRGSTPTRRSTTCRRP